MSFFRSIDLQRARALAAKDWSHPRVLREVRRLAHSGATLQQIIEAVGWTVTPEAARIRLRKFNIILRTKRAKLGFDTTLSNHNSSIDFRAFKARTLEVGS